MNLVLNLCGKKMKEVINNINKDGMCSKNNQKEKRTKILFHSEYDDPGIYEEFAPHWGPGSKYKPWIYGK